MLASFVLSAMWHGLYPAYFLSFVYLALGIEASRKVTIDQSTINNMHVFCGEVLNVVCRISPLYLYTTFV